MKDRATKEPPAPEDPKRATLSRRRFVGMVAAGSAALIAAPAMAATAVRTPRPRRTVEFGIGNGPGSPEFERQRRSTLETLAVIRKHAMPPGTEMASVFRPLKSTRKGG